MSLSRRFLNLIVGNQMTCGVRSLHCIDLTRQQFFRPSPSPPATKGGSETAVEQDSATQRPVKAAGLMMEQFEIPDPTLTFQAQVDDRWNLDCFPLADCKVLCADQSGRAFLFDADTRHLVTMPNLHQPKRRPFSLFVPNADAAGGGCGGSLFVMERIPKPEAGCDTHTSGQFEAFVYRKPTVTSLAESWRCQPLPPPPYLRDYRYCKRRHRITAYGVVDGGSQVCISVEDVGTYCLDTVSHTWSHVGEWTLPFIGKIEYVPEFKLWFGLSAGDQQHLAAADLSSLDSQPQLLAGPWKELEPHEEWQEWQEAQLVNLGSGRFCIAKFFETIAMGGDDSSDQSIVVLTSVEVTPRLQDGNGSSGGCRNGEVELEMNTHKLLHHMSDCIGIDFVF